MEHIKKHVTMQQCVIQCKHFGRLVLSFYTRATIKQKGLKCNVGKGPKKSLFVCVSYFGIRPWPG